PFTSIGRFAGHRLLDGGIIDSAPAFLADDIPGLARNLVLLTTPYPARVTGRHGSRLYLAPTEPLPISPWDFTQPDAVRQAVEAGERDAARYDSLLTEFLG